MGELYRCTKCGQQFINEVSEAETEALLAAQFPGQSAETCDSWCENCVPEAVIVIGADDEAMRDPELCAFVEQFAS